MKTVHLFIKNYYINTLVGNELELSLAEEATILDVIKTVDEMISRKEKSSSEPEDSLLYRLYNPVKDRFYKQVSIIAYTKPGEFLNVRDHPQSILPKGVIVHVNPEGPCITEWEKPIDVEIFKRITRYREN